MLRPVLFHCFALAAMTSLVAPTVSAANLPAPQLGRAVAPFVLRDYRGKEHALNEYQDAKVVVVCFMGTQCPLAKLYGPKLERLHAKYASQGVVVLGVFSNVQDSIKELAAFARDHALSFPVLRDQRNSVADDFRATRTPEVVVLDADRKVRYQGRIDEQYTFGSGVGLAKPVAKRNDLEMAVQELLQGRKVSVARTAAKGCLIGRVRKPNADAAITYSNQIIRIFQRRCIECHREGQIAPFTLTDYEEAAGWGEMIAEVVEARRMPPWHANPAHGDFSNENRLSDKEKQQIHTWVENGCPQGNVKDLPQPQAFHESWYMSRKPDRVIYMADEAVDVKAEGVESYRRYVVDPGFKEDQWVTIAECMPGNRAIVHHIIVYIISPDAQDSNIGEHELLVGYAPGTRPFLLPKGWARKIPAGAKLQFEMHYTPIGTPQKDRSSLGLVFTEREQVTHHAWTTNAINGDINIPPHKKDYRLTAEKPFDEDVLLISMFPHMHMRGKSFRYDVTFPDGKQETLLDVPLYDFNWQSSFVLRKPMRIPKGTVLKCTAVYDNSAGNLANPDPTKVVRWGQQTWDEMMIGWHDVAVRLPR